MPEAPIHEYRRPVCPQHNIRLPRHRLHIQPIPIPMTPQPPPHLQLRLRPRTLDMRHAPMPLLRCHRVGHCRLFLIPTEGRFVWVYVFLCQYGTTLRAASHGVGIECATALTGGFPSPSSAKINILGTPTAVTIHRTLSVEPYAIVALESVSALAASYVVGNTHCDSF